MVLDLLDQADRQVHVELLHVLVAHAYNASTLASELHFFSYLPLLTAIPTWNEYMFTRVSLNDPATFTLPIALQNLNATSTPQQNVLMAASMIIVIPVVILFALLQRYFVNGLQGAVKG